MEREFREESISRKSPWWRVAIKTEILGYFRWVRRGGKPEFVGISRTETPSWELSANPREVDAPVRIRLVHPARDLDELRSSIAILLADKQLSVPLWVNLICLKESLDGDPERWKTFLAM
jgi:hypothetical protein